MRHDAWLINLGRGTLVDEPALISALLRGTIGGAALDVFADEPLPADSPLWALPNVIVSPHMSADFHGWEDALVGLFLRQLRRYRSGKPLANIVDKRLGFIPGPSSPIACAGRLHLASTWLGCAGQVGAGEPWPANHQPGGRSCLRNHSPPRSSRCRPWTTTASWAATAPPWPQPWPTPPGSGPACGPRRRLRAGSLTRELATRLGPGNVAAIDPAPQFAAACSARNPGADVRTGVAEQLPWPAAHFDAALSSLVIGFLKDPGQGVREMARVTHPGGTVAACMWDTTAGGMTMLRIFWNAVRQIEPAAAGESAMAGTSDGDIARRLRQACRMSSAVP